VKPRLLDLFCGAGGASVGYARAGFEVVGVDIRPQPRYPFEFHQADAMDVLNDRLLWNVLWEQPFDAIHASPPCQAYSRMSNSRPGVADKYPRLVEEVRDAFVALRLPYVIENVPGAPLRDPLTLCGSMFGLKVYRHRLFESPHLLFAAAPCHHPVAMPRAGRVHPDGWVSVAGHSHAAASRAAMGIDWMTRDELSEAIPPAYTEWIGGQLMAHLQAVAA
jgi:DNA (cytosine-5)-methyltransferase 1